MHYSAFIHSVIRVISRKGAPARPAAGGHEPRTTFFGGLLSIGTSAAGPRSAAARRAGVHALPALAAGAGWIAVVRGQRRTQRWSGATLYWSVESDSLSRLARWPFVMVLQLVARRC
jgi:hypothetical protein